MEKEADEERDTEKAVEREIVEIVLEAGCYGLRPAWVLSQ